MKRRSWRFAVVLAACTSLAVLTASTKAPVARPFQMAADSQLVIVVDPLNPDYGTYVAHAEGVASHLGWIAADEAGVLAPVTHGVITAANGNLLNYSFDTTTAVATVTGGTGRFTGASGQFTIVVQPVGPPVLDPIAGTMTQSFTWTGSGTITY